MMWFWIILIIVGTITTTLSFVETKNKIADKSEGEKAGAMVQWVVITLVCFFIGWWISS